MEYCVEISQLCYVGLWRAASSRALHYAARHLTGDAYKRNGNLLYLTS